MEIEPIINANAIMPLVYYSAGAMLTLNASCQGIIETYISPSSSGWYTSLETELLMAQRLVREWRTNGTLYYNENILNYVISCSQAFTSNKDSIINDIDELIGDPNNTLKTNLINKLNVIKSALDSLMSNILLYQNTLQAWGAQMQESHAAMLQTVNEIQAQEADIQAQINSINTTISNMQNQIKVDKEAIAKAEAAEKVSKIEVIFGIIFAPLTGGASLILAGIGVASIVDAEKQVSDLQSSINTYKTEIIGYQHDLNDDQKQIATLKVLNFSVQDVLNDMTNLSISIDHLTEIWSQYQENITNIISDIDKAQSSNPYIVAKAWFNAALLEWNVVSDNTVDFQEGPVATRHIDLK